MTKQKEYNKQYYLKNKEHLNKLNKEYYKNNKQKITEQINKNLNTNPQKSLWIRSKTNAKKRGIFFDIQINDIIIPEYCPYLNIKLRYDASSPRADDKISLDRIDNSKGYVKGNIQVISDLANRMKNNATLSNLLIFATNVLKLHA